MNVGNVSNDYANPYQAGINPLTPSSNTIPENLRPDSVNPEITRPRGFVSPSATEGDLRKEGYSTSEIKDLKRAGKIQCEACSNRTYQDKSNDSGVSFQAPTKLSPAQAAIAVPAHEGEHVTRNAAKAESEDRTAESAVRIFTSVCSECGISYVSGGETRTVTRKKAETQDFADKFEDDKITRGVGKNVDETA
ncbi:MAG: hypothetical protein FWE91_11965 [Defluviitaleaceae bacterium]|nr:hypothetical protein [Defluviitaleaceae bacterium]MCL2836432.1 hypothetical protein [Defluviitaleaceae bacterium]